jgi:hypothetical protein
MRETGVGASTRKVLATLTLKSGIPVIAMPAEEHPSAGILTARLYPFAQAILSESLSPLRRSQEITGLRVSLLPSDTPAPHSSRVEAALLESQLCYFPND